MAAVRQTSTDYAHGLGTIPLDMPPGPLKIKEKSYSTNTPPSDMPTYTVKLYWARQLHCHYNIYACLCRVTPLQLQHICLFAYCNCTAAVQTCLLVDCCCKIDACWTIATQSGCLSIFCHSILHVCWCCASLSAITAGMVSAMPAGVVPHYRPCHLVWCLTISRAC